MAPKPLWKPMNTAPRSGQTVFFWDAVNRHIQNDHWVKRRKCWHYMSRFGWDSNRYTHWLANLDELKAAGIYIWQIQSKPPKNYL